MRKLIVAGLLRLLNSRLLNQSPCRFGFIGNVDAFDIANLRSEVKQRPDLTVAQLIREAELFAVCLLRTDGLTVIEDGVVREADIRDYDELANLARDPR